RCRLCFRCKFSVVPGLMLINVEQNGNEFSVIFQATGVEQDDIYRRIFEGNQECPMPSGTLLLYAQTDGIYRITDYVDAGTCKTLAIMISENLYWANRKESL